MMDPGIDRYLEYASLEKNLSPATVDAYRRDLISFSRWLEPRDILPGKADPGDIAEFLHGLSSSGYSPLSVRRKLSSLRSFYRFLQRSGEREDNPAELIHPPKKPQRLPHGVDIRTVESMLAVWSGDTPLSLRNRALLELAYGAGLRESELTDMTVSRVMLEEALVRPLGKGSRERLVPLGGAAVRWLSLYIDAGRPQLAGRGSGDRLFLTYRGNPLSRMTVWNIVRRSALMAGVESSVHPHTLRHSFATHLLQGGADLRVVQELLGHADIKTTEIYTGVDRAWLRSIVDRFHPRGE